MPQLIKGRAIAADDWVLAGTEAAEAARKLVLPLPEYVAAALAGGAGPDRGVLLKPEDHDLEPLRPYLALLPIVVVQFPTSGEGRGYTQASLLRERFGYKGELRARGAVRVDQVWFMARCGFDSFELAEGEDPAVAIAQLDRFSVAYQPGTGRLTHARMR